MNDSIWYYARGDAEKGPITTAQIKALVGAGKLRREDFVWKEGMESWAPAGDVGDLFPVEKKSDEGAKTEPAKRPDSRTDQPVQPFRRKAPPIAPLELSRVIGRGLFVLGLLVALLSRGCDGLSYRNMTRLKAVAESARKEFQDDWERQRQQIQDELELLNAIAVANRSNTDNERLRQLNAADSQLQQDMPQKKRLLENGQWLTNDQAAENAAADHRVSGYWRQFAFLLGTVSLTLGLLVVGHTCDGPERWISFVILAVIVYSLYNAGGVWDGVFS